MSTDPADPNLSDDQWWLAMCAVWRRVHQRTNAEIEAELDATDAPPLTEEQVERMLGYVRETCIEQGVEPPRRSPRPDAEE